MSSVDDFNVVVETITPLRASELLELMPRNRSVSTWHVDRLARDMANGDWVLNGETIKLNDRNELIDGQHRLHAIIKSGTAAQMLVIYNVSDHLAQHTTDQGRKRSIADALKIEYGYTMASTIAAAISFMWRWQNDRLAQTSHRPSYAESVRLLEEHKGLLDSVDRVRRFHGLKSVPRINPSAAAFTHYAFTSIDSDDGEAFWNMYESPWDFGLSKNHPALRLHLYMQGVQTANDKSTSQIKNYALIVKAWNAFVDGQDVGTLKWGAAESLPRIAGSDAIEHWRVR